MYNNNQQRQAGYSAGGRRQVPPAAVSSYSFQQGQQMQMRGNGRQGSVTLTPGRGNSASSVQQSYAGAGIQQQQSQQYQYQQNSPQQNAGSGLMTRSTRSNPVMHMQPAGQQASGGYAAQSQLSQMRTYQTADIPKEIEGNPNVQYVRMNWEDILGGKNGLQGLQVSMGPNNGDPNANRQIRIGMGGSETPPNDGSTPLRILSFQPVENYSGLKEPTAPQPGQPKFSVLTGPAAIQNQAQQSQASSQRRSPGQPQGQAWTGYNGGQQAPGNYTKRR